MGSPGGLAATRVAETATWWRTRLGANVVAAVGLLVAAVLFYYPLVFFGRVVVDYDAFVYFYPLRAELARALASGRIPLWNPMLFMGSPFLANPQTAVFYPPSWLFVLGPVELVYSMQLVLHAWFGALFTYLFARYSLRVTPLAAAAGGLAFGFSGFTVAQSGHLNQLSAGVWLPAVLVAYDRAVALRSVRWAAAGALALGLQVLAGHPQVTYMTLFVLAVFGIVRAPWRSARGLFWALAAGVLVGVLGVGLSAVQLLPTLELAPLSIRGGGVHWEDAVAGSVPYYLMPRALFPPFWLNVASTEYLGYSGVAPLTLAFLGFLLARSRMVVFAIIVCFAGLFLAAGENNGYYGLLFSTMPSFDTFRVPARWLFVWIFGISTLAALGAGWIDHGARIALRRRDLWPRVIVVAAVLAAGLSWQVQYGEPFAQRRVPGTWLAIVGATLMLGGIAAMGWTRVALLGLLALTAGELWAAADWSPPRRAVPYALLNGAGASAPWLREHAPGARLLSVAQPEFIPGFEAAVREHTAGLSERSIQDLLVARKWRETLTPNLPLQFGLATADGYDGGVLPLQRFVTMSTLLIPPDQVRPDGVLITRLREAPPARLLDILGIDTLVLNAGESHPAGAQAQALEDAQVVVRRDGAGRFALVSSADVLTDDAALARMREPSFDPREAILLAPGPGAEAREGSRNAGAVTPRVDSPERWGGTVRSDEPAYLLQREAWYPGWRAWVDGVETPVLRADVLFRAVALPAGEHLVELRFESDSFQRGAIVSVGTAIVLALLIAGSAWRAHRGVPRDRT